MLVFVFALASHRCSTKFRHPTEVCLYGMVTRRDDWSLRICGPWRAVFENQAAIEWVDEYMRDEQRMEAMPVTQALVEEAQRRWTALDDEDIMVDDTSVLIVTIPQLT